MKLVHADPLAESSPRHRFQDPLTILFLIALLAGAALVVVFPWLAAIRETPSGLARYVPLRDGDSTLTITYDAADHPQSWSASNISVLLRGRAPLELRKAPLDVLLDFYTRKGEERIGGDELVARLEDAQIYRTRSRTIDTQGKVTTTESITLRDPLRGEYLVGSYYPDDALDITYNPPMLLMPNDVGPDRKEWMATGVSSSITYTQTGRIIAAKSFAGPLGNLDDCLQLEVQSVHQSTRGRSEYLSQEYLCPGLGVIESHDLDAKGTLVTRYVVVSTLDQRAQSAELPVMPLLEEPAAPRDLSSWSLDQIAQVGGIAGGDENTIIPTWLPTDPPLLLAATHDGDLVAYRAAPPAGSVAWRFHTGGVVFGEPGFDAARGRIYFGASDKRLYALDARGIFLWSFQSGDNIASRPLVVSDTIVFGSEDRKIYGLDANTGKPRWQIETGGPVVSSPALAGNIVVIGSDDGRVRGVDAATGKPLWLYDLEKAVEAPIVVEQNIAYVASRDGKVYALEAQTGRMIWSAQAGSGAVLRTAPAVGANRVFVTDAQGHVTAFARDNGARLWRTAQVIYVGTPVIVGNTLVVAASQGSIRALSFDGNEMSNAWSSTDADTSYRLGPSVGGDALWFGDDKGFVRRLGPRSANVPAALPLIWTDSLRTSFTLTPAEYAGDVVALDSTGHIYLIDPSSGNAVMRGQIQAESMRLDPVVAGNILLTINQGKLDATNLNDGTPLWSIDSKGSSWQPVTVTGSTVLWMTQASDRQSGTLHALDLNTGVPRWDASLDNISFAGGAVARGDTVYISSPPAAFDLASGAQRWQARIPEQGLGGPVLDANGDTLFVILYGESGSAIAAINARDGNVKWKTASPLDLLTFEERVWVSGDTLVIPSAAPAVFKSGKGAVLALNTRDGSQRWRFVPPAARLGSVTIDRGRVWMMLEDGTVLGLDAQSGSIVAQYRTVEMNLNGAGFAQRPLIVGDTLIAPLREKLTGLRVNGHD